VNHGTPAQPNWACEFLPFVSNDAALKFLLNAERREEGSRASSTRHPRSRLQLMSNFHTAILIS
jgi:hypothetical protein